MNDSRINSIDFQTKVYNVRELRRTQQGNAVCNARVKTNTQLDDEWQSSWFDLTAWDEAADVLAGCSHGDEVIIRGGRLGCSAYNSKEGLTVEPRITTNQLERVGSLDAGAPARTPPPADSDVPF